MTLATSAAKLTSLAPIVNSTMSRLRCGSWRCAAAMRSLSSASCAGAVPEQAVNSHDRGTFVGALAAEHADLDGGPGARERQEGHGKMRLLDRECERGAHLIAVERAMASRIHPTRAVARPVFCRGRARRSVLAGAVVGKAGAARPEVLAAATEAPEAEAAFELAPPCPDRLRPPLWNRQDRR